MKLSVYWRILTCCRVVERVLLVIVILLTPLMWVLDAGIDRVLWVWVTASLLFMSSAAVRIRLAKKGPPV